jgi:hypothetical protein
MDYAEFKKKRGMIDRPAAKQRGRKPKDREETTEEELEVDTHEEKTDEEK